MEIKSISVKLITEGEGESIEFGLEADVQPEENLAMAYRDAYMALLDAARSSQGQRRHELGGIIRGHLGSKWLDERKQKAREAAEQQEQLERQRLEEEEEKERQRQAEERLRQTLEANQRRAEEKLQQALEQQREAETGLREIEELKRQSDGA